MMHNEFLELAGVTDFEVPYNVYAEVIEPMYMGTDLSKQDFVKFINIKGIIANTENPARYAKEIAEAHARKDFDEVIRKVKAFANLLNGSPEWYEHIGLGLFDLVYFSSFETIVRIDTYRIMKRGVKIIRSFSPV